MMDSSDDSNEYLRSESEECSESEPHVSNTNTLPGTSEKSKLVQSSLSDFVRTGKLSKSREVENKESPRDEQESLPKDFMSVCESLAESLSGTLQYFKKFEIQTKNKNKGKAPVERKRPHKTTTHRSTPVSSEDQDASQASAPKRAKKAKPNAREKEVRPIALAKKSLVNEREVGELSVSTDDDEKRGGNTRRKSKATHRSDMKEQEAHERPCQLFESSDEESIESGESDDEQWLSLFGKKGDFDQAVTERLAKSINLGLTTEVEETTLTDICKDIKRPANIPNLVVPKTNEQVWKSLTSGQRKKDLKLQRTQAIVVKGLCTTVKAINELNSAREERRSTDLKLLRRAMKDTLKLSVTVYTELNQRRLESLSMGLADDYKKLCRKPFISNISEGGPTDLLFGQKLNDKIKELKEESKVSLTASNSKNARPGKLWPNRPGFYTTQSVRGRGRGQHQYRRRFPRQGQGNVGKHQSWTQQRKA